MPNEETLHPVERPVVGVVRPPGSKSLTNRALVVAGLAEGRSSLSGCLESDDTRYMAEVWNQLGAGVSWDIRPATRQLGPQGEPPTISSASATIVVDGCGGEPAHGPLSFFVGNAGTAMRFMTAVVSLGRGEYLIDGVERMRHRPIEDLLTALRQLGVNARCHAASGCPPVTIETDGLHGGSIIMTGQTSSQFISGILLAAPYSRHSVEILVRDELVSKPYVDMTVRLMEDFGVQVEAEEHRRFYVPAPQRYEPRDYAVEPDATAATYFWALAAITGGAVTVADLSGGSCQGDVHFADVLHRMGCRITESPRGLTVEGPRQLRGIDVDLNDMPDTALTLAVAALFADGPTTIRNVATLRVKETDRLAALATELRKFGASVDEGPDSLTIRPPAKLTGGASIATYDDHRMAMSFALAALRVPGVTIENPQCVGKTFPDYFDVLRQLVGQEQ